MQFVGDRIGLRVGQPRKACPAGVSATSGDTKRWLWPSTPVQNVGGPWVSSSDHAGPQVITVNLKICQINFLQISSLFNMLFFKDYKNCTGQTVKLSLSKKPINFYHRYVFTFLLISIYHMYNIWISINIWRMINILWAEIEELYLAKINSRQVTFLATK